MFLSPLPVTTSTLYVRFDVTRLFTMISLILYTMPRLSFETATTTKKAQIGARGGKHAPAKIIPTITIPTYSKGSGIPFRSWKKGGAYTQSVPYNHTNHRCLCAPSIYRDRICLCLSLSHKPRLTTWPPRTLTFSLVLPPAFSFPPPERPPITLGDILSFVRGGRRRRHARRSCLGFLSLALARRRQGALGLLLRLARVVDMRPLGFPRRIAGLVGALPIPRGAGRCFLLGRAARFLFLSFVLAPQGLGLEFVPLALDVFESVVAEVSTTESRGAAVFGNLLDSLPWSRVFRDKVGVL